MQQQIASTSGRLVHGAQTPQVVRCRHGVAYPGPCQHHRALGSAPTRPTTPGRSQQVFCAAASDGPSVSPASRSDADEQERTSKIRAEVTRRIKAHGEAGRMKAAIQELAGLAKVGVQPDLLAATALVRACTRDMELAQGIFDELFGDLLSPDEVAYAVLLRGYGSRDPPDWQRIDMTLSAMRRNHSITPTAVSYNALLEVCCRTNDLERAEDVIDRMAADGVEPDEFTESTVSSRRSLRSYLRKTLYQ